LLQILVLLAGSALPFVYEAWSSDFRRFDFSFLQVTNWVWALGLTMDRRPPALPYVVLISSFAGIILLLNLFVVRREVHAVRRVRTPERVLREQASS
jgi:hypothetical protein